MLILHVLTALVCVPADALHAFQTKYLASKASASAAFVVPEEWANVLTLLPPLDNFHWSSPVFFIGNLTWSEDHMVGGSTSTCAALPLVVGSKIFSMDSDHEPLVYAGAVAILHLFLASRTLPTSRVSRSR